MTAPKTKAELQQQRNKVRNATQNGLHSGGFRTIQSLEELLTPVSLQLASSYSELLEYVLHSLRNLDRR